MQHLVPYDIWSNYIIFIFVTILIVIGDKNTSKND